MERRTITPLPWRVTAAFSATAPGGQAGLSVLGWPVGTTRRPLTEKVRTADAPRRVGGHGEKRRGRCDEPDGESEERIRPLTRFFACQCGSMLARDDSLILLIAQAGSGSGGFGGGGGGFRRRWRRRCAAVGHRRRAIRSWRSWCSACSASCSLYLIHRSGLYRRKVRKRDRRVRTASAEAAEDDAYFASDELERHAARALQCRADGMGRPRPRRRSPSWCGPDLLVEWNRRLDDFDRKGWHNRVEVLADPTVAVRGDHQPRGRRRGPRGRPDRGEAERLRRGRERQAGHARRATTGRAHDARGVLDARPPRRRSGWSCRSSSARRATTSWTSRSWPRRGPTTSGSRTSR